MGEGAIRPPRAALAHRVGEGGRLDDGGGFLQVLDELPAGSAAGFLIGSAKDRGGMNGRQNVLRQCRRHELAALLADPKFATEKRLCRRCAKAD
jgi:hypothetical protein